MATPVHNEANPEGQQLRIGYLVSRFPEISETFILDEMLGLQAAGIPIEIFPLLRQSQDAVHAEALPLDAKAHEAPLFSSQVESACDYWRRKQPNLYRQIWRRAILGNLRSPRFLLRAFAVVPKAACFAKRMQETGITHIHAHWATHPGLAATCVHHLTAIPYSLTLHAHDLFVNQTMLEEKLRSAALIVTISNFNRDFIINHCAEAVGTRLHVVHCGVDITRLDPGKRLPEQDPPVVLCIASLETYKGHDILLDACAALRQQGVAFRCLCVGQGSLAAKLARRIRRLGLEPQVQLLGARSRDEVLDLLRSASLLVQPSIVARNGRMEGIPVALMEALAMALPVVATDISGISELVQQEQTGLLVPERDPSGLAAAMARLLGDRHLANRLGKAGRQKVVSEFNLQQTVPRLLDLIRAP